MLYLFTAIFSTKQTAQQAPVASRTKGLSLSLSQAMQTIFKFWTFLSLLGYLKPLSEVCSMITVSAKLLLSDKMAVTSR
jgi:hypothetical protein